jgi:hypothetical protein
MIDASKFQERLTSRWRADAFGGKSLRREAVTAALVTVLLVTGAMMLARRSMILYDSHRALRNAITFAHREPSAATTQAVLPPGVTH